ncbi:MAG: 50S ribosomal protein L9 [Candidatus Marinimicrobia bacterium]|nr:50S ribosomal protein L9 [Candidatus Neomarinimicrobiota bacterium]MCH8069936.1 50S ribosomal protein L9 [Candidatus Neomarinimicrobiota bacterium]
MDVILRQKIEKLGDVGDIIRVKPGYARNYLIPKGMAVAATQGNINMVKAQKKKVDFQQMKAADKARAIADMLSKLKLSAPVKVGKEDRVFGSVTAITIAELLKKQGIDVNKKDVLLDEPIKALGIYNIPVKLHHDVEVEVKVYVIKA